MATTTSSESRCPGTIKWDAHFTYFTIASVGKFSLRFLVKWKLECGPDECGGSQVCRIKQHRSAPNACVNEMFEEEYFVQSGNKYWGRNEKCGALVLDWLESHPECYGGRGYVECWQDCATHLKNHLCLPDFPFGGGGFTQDSNVEEWIPGLSDSISEKIDTLQGKRKCKCQCQKPIPPPTEPYPSFDPRLGFDSGDIPNGISQHTSFITPDGRIKK